jgi:hypothetical protein
MKITLLKAEIESALSRRFDAAGRLWADPEARPAAMKTISTRLEEVDALTGGLPRGAITEVFGPASSGRTSLLCSVLAAATARKEICALVDTSDTFDPRSGAQAGIDLDRLLWIRCSSKNQSLQKRFGGHPVERALQVTDWLLQGGGFGIVVFDLGDIPRQTARRISLTSWFRLRRAIENTPTVLLVISQEPQAKSCASRLLYLQKAEAVWTIPACSARLLKGVMHRLECRKPVRSAAAAFQTRAVAGSSAGWAA